MVHKHCFVTNCPLSSEESNVVSMLCVPKGKFKEWQEIMKHKPGLTNNSRFCSRHFNLEDSKRARNSRNILSYSMALKEECPAIITFRLLLKLQVFFFTHVTYCCFCFFTTGYAN